MYQIMTIFLHLDRYIDMFIASYGALTYAALFVVIFIETGLVVTPFLPGDSLIFAAAAFAARGSLSIGLLVLLLILAAFTGNALNFFLGGKVGSWLSKSRFINPKHIRSAEAFFEKYGGMAVVLGRFAPIIRTFVPFVAGIGHMNPARFTTFNIIGCVLWVGLASGAGYFFGNIPVVKDHFSLVCVAIIVISLLPAALTFISERRKARIGAGGEGGGPG